MTLRHRWRQTGKKNVHEKRLWRVRVCFRRVGRYVTTKCRRRRADGSRERVSRAWRTAAVENHPRRRRRPSATLQTDLRRRSCERVGVRGPRVYVLPGIVYSNNHNQCNRRKRTDRADSRRSRRHEPYRLEPSKSDEKRDCGRQGRARAV